MPHTVTPPSLPEVILPHRLTVCSAEESGAVVTYLGYPLLLSPTERRILMAVIRAEADDRPVGAAALCARLAADDRQAASSEAAPSEAALSEAASSEAASSEATVTVLIGRINRKASAIGGRRLLILQRGRGYIVNPYA